MVDLGDLPDEPADETCVNHEIREAIRADDHDSGVVPGIVDDTRVVHEEHPLVGSTRVELGNVFRQFGIARLGLDLNEGSFARARETGDGL